jgi:hypothetical protein
MSIVRLILLVALTTAVSCTTADPDSPISTADCIDSGGRAYTDPGNGSLEGCPEGLTQTGILNDAIEGGFCCE